MIILNIHTKPYLAHYALIEYPTYHTGVVRFPAESLMNMAILSRLKVRPFKESPNAGNLPVLVNEETNLSKRTDMYNWITRADEGLVERCLRMDFNATLHYFMDSNRYNRGIDYKDSANLFVEKYGLAGLIQPEALLKKHVRWKKQIRDRRTGGEQTEFNFG